MLFSWITLSNSFGQQRLQPAIGAVLDVGIRAQKSIGLYAENGFTIQYAHSKLAAQRLFIGLSYVTSRLGTAFHSNAVRQDNFLATASYQFRPEWLIRPVAKLNVGYFAAHYGSPLFDELPKTSPLLSPEFGVCYCPDFPLKINASIGLRNLLLVDPIVIPSDKSLSLVGVVGPMLGYVETKQSASEDKVYYHFRPQETLQQLQRVLTVVRKNLEKGITLPPGCSMKVYKSKKDPTADPVSAVLIYQGVKTAEGAAVNAELIDSDFHVYTRLNLRDQVTAQDRQNQTDTFADIVRRVMR